MEELREHPVVKDSVDRILGTGLYAEDGPEPLKTYSASQTSPACTTETVVNNQDGIIQTTQTVHESLDSSGEEVTEIDVDMNQNFRVEVGPDDKTVHRYHQEKITAKIEQDGQLAKVTIAHAGNRGRLEQKVVEDDSVSRRHEYHKIEEAVVDKNERRDILEVDLYQKKAPCDDKATKVFSTGHDITSRQTRSWSGSRSRSRSVERGRISGTAGGDNYHKPLVATHSVKDQVEVSVISVPELDAVRLRKIVCLYSSPHEIHLQQPGCWILTFSDEKYASELVYGLGNRLSEHSEVLRVFYGNETSWQDVVDANGPKVRGRSRERVRKRTGKHGSRSRSRSRSACAIVTAVEGVKWIEKEGEKVICDERSERNEKIHQ